MFARGWFGGGDAKLLAAGAVWMGPVLTAPYLTATAVAGGILALTLIVLRAMPWPNSTRNRFRLIQKGAPVPYGVAICAGAIWIFATKIKFLAANAGFLPSSLTALTMY